MPDHHSSPVFGRVEMLGQMAASIAAGIEANPTTSWTPEAVAERAVVVAESIIERIERSVQP